MNGPLGEEMPSLLCSDLAAKPLRWVATISFWGDQFLLHHAESSMPPSYLPLDQQPQRLVGCVFQFLDLLGCLTEAAVVAKTTAAAPPTPQPPPPQGERL